MDFSFPMRFASEGDRVMGSMDERGFEMKNKFSAVWNQILDLDILELKTHNNVKK